MSKSETWMPLYIGDYLGDTMHLEAREHGAYLLLLMHYWRNGPLPDDDRALAGIARVDRKTWIKDTGPIVRGFFTTQDGRLHQKRLDAERASADAISATKRDAARKRWESQAKPDKADKPPGGSSSGTKSDAYASPHAHANGHDVDAVCISPSPSQSTSKEVRPPVRPPTAAPPPPQPASASRAGRNTRRRMPRDWEPDEAARDVAAGLLLDCSREAAEFRSFWLGDGGRKQDWNEAFIARCYNRAEYRADRAKPSPRRETREEARNRELGVRNFLDFERDGEAHRGPTIAH